ncbi:MAG: TonB-dependent receptor [Candidatus Binatia bacterium]
MHRQIAGVSLALALGLLPADAALAQAATGRSAGASVAEDGGTSERKTTAPERRGTAGARDEQRGPGVTRLEEVVVEADKPQSAASSKVIRTRDYALRPHSTTQEILNNVPGLVVVQHQGGGKAVQYLIRGFDADHGTDFALFTDGVPVNMVTHGHGQGYADINYLIPETVRDLQLFKGPYFVELGDFSLAGALKIETKDEFQQNFALAEGGSFDTQRYVLGGSVPLSWAKTLLAAEAYFTNGPFENPQHYARYNAFAKLTLTPTADHRLSFLASAYSGDWDGSGQIPARIVGDGPGEISRFGSLDPSEGGKTDRETLSAQWRFEPSTDEEWSAQLWGSHYHLRLYSNFTFFRDTGLRFYVPPGTNRFVDRCAALGGACPALPDPSIPLNAFVPGDGIEQDDSRLLWGGFAQYSRFWTLSGVPGLGAVPMQTAFGITARGDDIDLALWRQVRRTRFLEVNAVAVYEQSISGYWGQQIFLTDWARLTGGVRGDVFFFDVRNRLPQQNPDPNFAPVPIQGDRTAGLASPKANLVLGPWHGTEYYLNFGYGFHSNDARSVVLTGTDGLVQGYGYELGARTRQFGRLDAAAALWLLDLDSELVFSGDGGSVDAEIDPVTGNFVPGPPSRRWGVDFETRYRFTDWLFADYDLMWADPRFRNGDAIPLAPTLLMNGGLTADFSNGFAAAFRLRFLGNRPADESRTLTAQGYALLDLLLRYRWRNVEASLAFLNLTDTAWREAQFAESTCVNQMPGRDYADPPGTGQPCPAQGSRPSQMAFADGINGIAFTPGSPFGVRAGLQIFF